ncbi:MAG: hypothetical protein QXU18_12155 [Thermoplasmatales archaeon]
MSGKDMLEDDLKELDELARHSDNICNMIRNVEKRVREGIEAAKTGKMHEADLLKRHDDVQEDIKGIKRILEIKLKTIK